MKEPLLLKHEVIEEIEVPLYTGWHPLHIAAFNGDLEEVKRLIYDGAFILAVDIWGRTPLHYARRRKYGRDNDKVARLLINNGAIDSSPFDIKGRCPIDINHQYN